MDSEEIIGLGIATKLEGLKSERDQINLEIGAIQEFVGTSPARKYISLAKKSGWYKGEVKDITKSQFRGILGYNPGEAILNSKGKVNFEYCFDQIATEAGYQSDEDLKQDIEDCLDGTNRIKELKHDLKVIDSNIDYLEDMLNNLDHYKLISVDEMDSTSAKLSAVINAYINKYGPEVACEYI